MNPEQLKAQVELVRERLAALPPDEAAAVRKALDELHERLEAAPQEPFAVDDPLLEVFAALSSPHGDGRDR
jgi:hypothetical protein